jgi:hypothetical protein
MDNYLKISSSVIFDNWKSLVNEILESYGIDEFDPDYSKQFTNDNEIYKFIIFDDIGEIEVAITIDKINNLIEIESDYSKVAVDIYNIFSKINQPLYMY